MVIENVKNNIVENENIDPNVLKDDSSEMGDNEICAPVDETVPETTKRSTIWGIKVFKKWIEKRHVSVDFNTIDAAELVNFLKKLYAEVKRPNDEFYTPSAIVGIRAAIYRTIIQPPYMRSINILAGEKFMAANRVFLAKCKIYVARDNPKPNTSQQFPKATWKNWECILLITAMMPKSCLTSYGSRYAFILVVEEGKVGENVPPSHLLWKLTRMVYSILPKDSLWSLRITKGE